MRRRPAPVDLGLDGVGVRLRRASLSLDGMPVLRRVSLELEPGSHTLLVGHNGAGKSQLLKVLAAERWPTPAPGTERAYVSARGEPLDLRDLLARIQLVSAEQQDRYERYGWNYTVSTVVGTGCRGLNAPLGPLTRAEKARVSMCLARLGLSRLRRRRFLGLSYGQKRLVLIARALAAQPRLLLLDEIYNGLDTARRATLDRVIDSLCGTALTLVVTAHRAEDAPAGLDRALAIEGGIIRYAGPRAGLPARHAAHVRDVAESVPTAPGRNERRATPAARPAAPLVELEDVAVYRDYRPVLRDLNWRVGAGEHWAILGPNGSGKTTLLQLLHGALWAADGGKVRRRGHEPGDRVEAWQARVRLLGPDSHTEALLWDTLEQVVLSGIPELRRLDARPTRAQRATARAALREVGLARLATRHPRAVSYGQLRLALLARALVNQPEALLLDEPLTGLDAPTRDRLRTVLSAATHRGTHIIAAVHHADDLVPEITHTLVLPGGRTRRRRARTA